MHDQKAKYFFHFNTFLNLDRSTVPKLFLFLTVIEDFMTNIIIINQFVRYEIGEHVLLAETAIYVIQYK